jgi:hypothetical protein
MSERIEKLRAAVEELERELESLETVDPETQALLEEVREEIQRALEDHEEPSPAHAESLIDRLKEAGRTFDAEHPTLGGVVTRMINALAQMGI